MSVKNIQEENNLSIEYMKGNYVNIMLLVEKSAEIHVNNIEVVNLLLINGNLPYIKILYMRVLITMTDTLARRQNE